MPVALRAVIFDMDGLLLDSEPYWQEAERRGFRDVGLELSDSDLCQTIGMRIDAVVRFRFRQRPWDAQRHRLDAVEERIVARVSELIAARAAPLPGVAAALHGARDRGLLRALASSSPMRIIEAALAALGLEGEFDFVYSAEAEAEGKPHPGVYRTTAARLGVDAADCIALEDSVAGLHSALAAGMRCVMVPDPRLRGHPDLAAATLVLDSLEQLDAGVWERLC